MVKDRTKTVIPRKSSENSNEIKLPPSVVTLVASKSHEGAYYLVEKRGNNLSCSCPGFKFRNNCKHTKNG